MGDNVQKPGGRTKNKSKKRSMVMKTDAKMKEKYISPEVEVMGISLEKGFAISEVETEGYSETGYDPNSQRAVGMEGYERQSITF